jgi:hypothetical protein
LLKYDITPVFSNLNSKKGTLQFFNSLPKNNLLSFKNYHLLNFIKSLLFFFSKFNNDFLLDYKNSLALHSKSDLLADKFVKPKNNFNFKNEFKFIKFILSENKDYSLINLLSYRESLT